MPVVIGLVVKDRPKLRSGSLDESSKTFNGLYDGIGR